MAPARSLEGPGFDSQSSLPIFGIPAWIGLLDHDDMRQIWQDLIVFVGTIHVQISRRYSLWFAYVKCADKLDNIHSFDA